MSTVWFKVNIKGKGHFSLGLACSYCILPPSSQDFMGEVTHDKSLQAGEHGVAQVCGVGWLCDRLSPIGH